jgi:hypothetical protein
MPMKTRILPAAGMAAALAFFAGCDGSGPASPAGLTTDASGGFADAGTYLRQVQVADDGELSAAFSDVRPGDMIELAAATFSGGIYRVNVKGTEANPIMIAGDPAGGTVVSGGGNCMQLQDPEYVVIQDIEFRGASSNGLNIDDAGTYDTPAHHVVLRRLKVLDIGSDGNQDGVKLSGVDHFLIEDCEIGRCADGGTSGSGIDMVGCHHGTIRGNYIHETGGNGIQGKGATEDVLIWRNRFFAAGERGLKLGG